MLFDSEVFCSLVFLCIVHHFVNIHLHQVFFKILKF